MFCKRCGASIEGGAAICPQCGTPTGGTVGAQTGGVQVPSHMAGAILTTLFCCLIGGIIAIIYAAQVNSKVAAGDIAGAQAASKTAKTWIIVNIVTGLLGVLIYGVLVFLGAAAAAAANGV